jgi:hypothetical protein
MRTIERAQEETERGRLWRAREILQGSVRSGYDIEVYEEYGKLLLRMGDWIEAGRFLFLSGARKVAYEEAIALYLSKHRGGPAELFRSFPRKARLVVLSTYPSAVERDLLARGFPKNLSLFPALPGRSHWRDEGGWNVGWGASVLLILAGLVLLVLLGLGWMKLKELHRKYPIIGNNRNEFITNV